MKHKPIKIKISWREIRPRLGHPTKICGCGPHGTKGRKNRRDEIRRAVNEQLA